MKNNSNKTKTPHSKDMEINHTETNDSKKEINELKSNHIKNTKDESTYSIKYDAKSQMFSPFDPNGSYTGVPSPLTGSAMPIQDADDL